MAILKTTGLEARFDLGDSEVHALRGVDLDIAEGEFFVLLGPSGCGKTTMLRSIAGLERPSSGAIELDGKVVFGEKGATYVPPDQRPIAMVFQSYAIWPHMDVFENVAFPLRKGRARLKEPELGERVHGVLSMLGLEALADRSVTTLSGGQQQRVALARALALRPRLLLMDEPLSNLDFKLQVRLRAQMRDLMHRLNLTTIHVTHNQAEALETGDRIAVMNQGRIVQIGDPQTIYHRPEHEFVARFIGDMNLIDAKFVSRDDDQACAENAFGKLTAIQTSPATFSPGDQCVLGIRPEDIVITDETPQSNANVVSGEIIKSNYVGEGFIYTVLVAGQEIRIKRHHNEEIHLGDRINIILSPRHAVLLSPPEPEDVLSEDVESLLAGA